MNPQMYPGMSARGRILCRIAVAAGLAAAFLVMASVFSPQRSKAGDLESVRDGVDATSTNPHEGLRSLGSLESRAHIVNMYSTPDGARYSIYDRETGRELGVLMTPQRLHEWFPELQLPTVDFSAPTDGRVPLMMAEPEAIEQ